MARAGMNPIRFLAEEDTEARDLMAAIAGASQRLRDDELENLAVLIAQKVAKIFGG